MSRVNEDLLSGIVPNLEHRSITCAYKSNESDKPFLNQSPWALPGACIKALLLCQWSSLLLCKPPQVAKPRGSRVAPIQPEEWSDLPLAAAGPADSLKQSRGICVLKSWDQRCSLGWEESNTGPFLESHREAQTVSGRGWGEGSKCGSRQWCGRAVENDGFKFLVMSHVEALLFLSKKRKQVNCDFLSGSDDGMLCGEFTGPLWSAHTHWAYWMGSMFQLSFHSLLLSCGNSGYMVRWSAQGCIRARLPVGSSALNANWKKLALLDQYGKVPQNGK